MKLRVIRLYPLFIVANVFGYAASLIAIRYWGGSFTGYAAWLPQSPLASTTSAFLFALLMLPSLYSFALYALNMPAWSLLYECAVNAVWAAARPKLSLRLLGGVVVIFGLGVVLCSLAYHGVDAGYRWDKIPGGIARCGYSFGAGLLIFELRRRFAERLKSYQNNRLCLTVLVFAGIVLAMPSIPSLDTYYDIIAVIVLFPLLALAGTFIKPVAFCERICSMLGNASYGVYILHIPLSAFVAALYTCIWGKEISGFSAIGFYPCLVAVVLALDVLYDKPIRRLLRRKIM
jgi:peptidoglycan/LPS O-acetylase OafA/YrhL